jgi:hypothetical protein
MIPNDAGRFPPDLPPTSYAWAVWLSSFGALSAYLVKLKAQSSNAFSLCSLASETVIASFVGIVTMYICDWQGLSGQLTAVSIAVNAHFSTRALFLLRKRWMGEDE